MTFIEVVALHLRLDGVVVDQETLGARYDALCTAGHPLACKWRAWDDWGRVERDALLRILDIACTGGDAAACGVLGVALASPGASKEAATRAASLLAPSCDAGSGRACLALARLADDADGATVLRTKACALGLPEGCPPVAVDPAAGCAAGRTTSCEDWLATAAGPDRLRALERLCHAGLRCDALAAARAAGERGAVQPGRTVARATWTEGGVLLGWDTSAWVDHAFVPIADLDHAELVVGGSRDEHFVLARTSGEPVVLPDLGCDGVIAGATALAKGGRLARARDAEGSPASSQCIDALAPNTPHRSGLLSLDARAGEEDAGALVRDALEAAIDGMWRCAEAAPPNAHLDPWSATLVHARPGPAAKVTPTTSSGVAEVDECFRAWLGGVVLGETAYKAQYTVRVEVAW